MKNIIYFGVLMVALLFSGCEKGDVLKKANEPLVRNIIVVGWDGADREVLEPMLKQGLLPNLQKLVEGGQYIPVKIREGATETKPGWSQILTGYNTEVMQVRGNNEYAPIPRGYTVFERLQKYFGKENIATFFVAAKQANVSARGPHEICINCIRRDKKTRDQLLQWLKPTTAPTDGGAERIYKKMLGEPYFNLQQEIDFYIDRLNSGENVLDWTDKLFRNVGNHRYIAFVHFEDPDEAGHHYGKSSSFYREAIIRSDKYLGKLIEQLKSYNQYNDSLIFLTSDHGFDFRKKGHRDAPNVFLVSSRPLISDAQADRRDITPTILDIMGIDLKSITPPLNGESRLLTPRPKL